jgi:hypothetical protein
MKKKMSEAEIEAAAEAYDKVANDGFYDHHEAIKAALMAAESVRKSDNENI